MISLLRNMPLLLLLFTSCHTPTLNQVDKIIQQSNAVYGFDSQDYKIEFDFRDYHYVLERNQGFYSYSRQITKEEKKIIDMIYDTIIEIDQEAERPKFTESGPKSMASSGSVRMNVTFGFMPSYANSDK